MTWNDAIISAWTGTLWYTWNKGDLAAAVTAYGVLIQRMCEA